jgi:hypothetical protein
MRRSFMWGLMGIALLAACAAGTEGTDFGDAAISPGDGAAGSDGSGGAGGSGGVVIEDDAANPGPPADSSTAPPVDSGSTPDTGHVTPPEDSGTEKDSGSKKSEDSGGGGEICKGYAPPAVSADCKSCDKSPCQANGCYGGYWCEISDKYCAKDPPSGCKK